MPRSTFGRLVEWSIYSLVAIVLTVGGWGVWQAMRFDSRLKALMDGGHPVSLVHLQARYTRNQDEECGWDRLKRIEPRLQKYELAMFEHSQSILVDEVTDEVVDFHENLEQRFPGVVDQLIEAINAGTWGFSTDDLQQDLIGSVSLLKSATRVLQFNARVSNVSGERAESLNLVIQMFRWPDNPTRCRQ